MLRHWERYLRNYRFQDNLLTNLPRLGDLVGFTNVLERKGGGTGGGIVDGLEGRENMDVAKFRGGMVSYTGSSFLEEGVILIFWYIGFCGSGGGGGGGVAANKE